MSFQMQSDPSEVPPVTVQGAATENAAPPAPAQNPPPTPSQQPSQPHPQQQPPTSTDRQLEPQVALSSLQPPSPPPQNGARENSFPQPEQHQTSSSFPSSPSSSSSAPPIIDSTTKPQPQPTEPSEPSQASQPTEASNIQTSSAMPSSLETAIVAKEGGAAAFSWLIAHTQIVIIFVGENETPFAMHKDLLCAKSSMFRDHFAQDKGGDQSVESVVRFGDTTPEVFGFAQKFLYTGSILSVDDDFCPPYDTLASIWKVGHDLGVAGLCDDVISAMKHRRNTTDAIPGVALLVKVWEDTPAGSSLRMLLIEWAAEFVRNSETSAEFAKSLPHEVLSELVLTMSRQSTAAPAAGNQQQQQQQKQPAAASVPNDDASSSSDGSDPSPPASALPSSLPRKTVKYIDQDEDEDEDSPYRPAKRPRKSTSSVANDGGRSKTAAQGQMGKANPRRQQAVAQKSDLPKFTGDQKLQFCRDLLGRMLSGPGFWTRLVGPFRHPVNPEIETVPGYFDKIKKPMDLLTIKRKMDHNQYNSHQEFHDDVMLIIQNCQQYWKPEDPLYSAAEKFQKAFEGKYALMNKWITKLNSADNY